VGRIGTVGTPGGNNALSKCDCLICVGTRNSIRQVSYNWVSFAPQAQKIIVDIDKAELNKPTVQGLKVCQDAKRFLQEMLTWDIKIDKSWLEELRFYDKEHPVELIGPYKFIHDLTSLLPEGAVVVCGNGSACVCMFQAGIVKKDQRIFWNSGCAAMGYDLPAAIGAHFASGEEVICITGDGSIQMNIQELQTIKHHKLPIKIFVLNNGGYRSIEMTQDNYFGGNYIGCNDQSGVSFPDFRKVADTYGLEYFNTDEDTLEEVLSWGGAALCEVMLGKDYIFSPKFTTSLLPKS
jgi:acetolactate synthase-1/2/3 large subunit